MTSEAKKSFENNPYHMMNISTKFHQSSPFVLVDIEVLLKIVFFCPPRTLMTSEAKNKSLE